MPRIYVIDDDEPLRAALKMLLQRNHDVMCFAHARTFLDVAPALLPGCLILDVHMPELGGLELQRWLIERHLYFPIVMMTGQSDIGVAVEAMKAGAVDFIEKPFTREEILESIRLAQELGLNPVKVNAVIIKGLNDHEIESLAEFAQRESLALRFIEFMPLDSGRAWLKEMVVPGREILRRLQTRFDLRPVQSKNVSETATRWTFADGRAEIGIIAPVSEPFCGHCNRIRLTADGQIRTCLFSVVEHNLRSRLRSDASDEAIQEYLKSVVLQKEDRHHIGEPDFVQPERTMSCIGG